MIVTSAIIECYLRALLLSTTYSAVKISTKHLNKKTDFILTNWLWMSCDGL